MKMRMKMNVVNENVLSLINAGCVSFFDKVYSIISCAVDLEVVEPDLYVLLREISPCSF